MFASLSHLRSFFVCAAGLAFVLTSAVAQVKVTAVASQANPVLAAIEQASRTEDYTIEQLRRFRDAAGNVTTVVERLEVEANGTTEPDFRLTMLSVVGQPTGSIVEQEWQRRYERYGKTFFRHGSFRIRNLAKASANYTVFPFGSVTIANRAAQCVVVYPNGGDRAIWVLYVDTQTNVPLYVAEFDDRVRMFAEIEAVTYSSTVPSLASAQPKAAAVGTSQLHSSFSAARAQVTAGAADLVEPDMSDAPEFTVERIELRTDPLNGRQRLLLTYTDGIDEFVVEQVPASTDPFAGLPSQAGGAHSIARFQDPALKALIFFDDSVSFHVSGRGSQKKLEGVARELFRQALAQ